jgi:predicted DCC family thiol-disulfide oxidoreductase YuxK
MAWTARGRNSEPPLTVWFDGDCPLCNREICWMRGQTRGTSVEYVNLRTESDPRPDTVAYLSRLHAQEAGGPVLTGAAAFAALWRRVPLLRPLGVAAQWPPMLWLLERAYRLFLRIRPALQALARAAERRRGVRA